MSKADNMLAILWLLKTEKRMTANQLAEELEIHIRSVYRYIDGLCASGVPIIADSGHNGGYCLLREFTEVPLFFDLEEQKALIHAARFADEAGYPFSDALHEAIAKLKRYTNPEQLHAIDRHSVGFDVISPLPDASLEPLLQELEVAAAEGYTLLMEYQKGYRDSSRKRRVDPYGLINWRNKWYMIAYCHLRHDIRNFRVDRINSLSRTEWAFQRPSNFSARYFFLENLLPDLQNQDQLISVCIQGSPQAINDLCDHWLFGHALQERSNEQVHFKLGEKAISTYVPYFLLPYGTSIQVLEPSFLRESLTDVISKLYNHYQKIELD
ncbi:Predicted DNA-binding transcriptional regulator YafY, contains an HTH and WYL domains [Lentibacillus halodurans]|uniref:Predicted DNA-binding transcriptional regulator YafY, contains an HTH and WYL domains n=1 Tax=Lentibacillus halodurans TaxID=237679 RepID=A0A1I0Y5F5_9BACI|nr:WYL domain-containing protein [Lentibacillus halodurans]SFB07678.1 Predicted DNA-binding transcriptional regulator YafY, contains an HTH and WYL domains [Lentibacillus halodurans]